jgi:hypothetical protein
MASIVFIVGNWAGKKETWAFAYKSSSDDFLASGQIEQPNTTKPLPAGAVEGALFSK